MFKKLITLIITLTLLIPHTPVYADGIGPVQRLGTGVPTSIAASPDGKTLAVGSSIGVWFLDAATLTPTGFWDTGVWVDSVAYSMDGRYLRVNEMVYEVTSENVVNIDEVAWINHRCSFDGRLCAKDFYDPYDPSVLISIQVIDTDTTISLKILERSTKAVAWSVDRAHLYSLFYDWRRSSYAFKEWDTQSWQITHTLEQFFTNPLTQALWSLDGTEIASGSRVWLVDDAHIVQTRSCQYDGTNGTFACQWPAMGYHYYDVRFYDQKSGRLIKEFSPHHILLRSAAMASDGQRLVTSGQDTIRGCRHTNNSGGYSRCRVVDVSTRIWTVESLDLLASLPPLFYDVAFSPDGNMVIGMTVSGVEVWDWQTGHRLWAAEDGASCDRYPQYYGDAHKQCLSISSNGKYVADYTNTSSNSNVHLYHLATGELVAILTGHTAPITAVAFSPDGTQVAASSTDGTILIWDVP